MSMADAPPPPTETPASADRPSRRWLWPGGLSARLLVLTILFVVGAGMLVLPATLATFEEQWLLDRIRAAELASTIAEADPGRKVTAPVRQQMLENAGVVSVAIQTDGMRRLILAAPRDLRDPYLGRPAHPETDQLDGRAVQDHLRRRRPDGAGHRRAALPLWRVH
jgi:hypothetical protein